MKHARFFDATMQHPSLTGCIKDFRTNFTEGLDLPDDGKLAPALIRWCEDCVRFALSLDYPTVENPAENLQGYLNATSGVLFKHNIMGMIDAYEIIFRAQFPAYARHSRTRYMIMRLAQQSTTVAHYLMAGLEPLKKAPTEGAPLGWTVHTFDGPEVYLMRDGKVDETPVTDESALQPGTRIAVCGLMGGYHPMVVVDSKWAETESGTLGALLKFGADSRGCWAATCLINTKVFNIKVPR
jgi:hypothetical protein